MIKIVSVGKIKESFFREAILEYSKRLSKYVKLEIIEVADEPLIEKALEKESERILKKISDQDFVITLEIDGKNMNSLEFSHFLTKTMSFNSNLTFVIGGSYGLHENVKKRSNYALSFSKMTFPHQMFRVILLKQIYRSFKINNNENYHK